MYMNQKLPEILAPAGSYDIMVRAFQAGADAVYLGGQAFGARAYASNFSEEELIQAIEYAQLHHRRIYLTVNTLLKDKEIDRLSLFLKAPYEAGLDGIIVQDFGVAGIIREEFPDLELHASTQMTITSPAGANALKQLGVTRVVPARELSLEELRAIKEETGLEVEVFVHGALCYCYSGQCLFSSMIGGRSGNRGRCAQPCRQKYSLSGLDEKLQSMNAEYYLSPKDLCGLESIPALMELGIDSFKIEGRMKKAEYVISAVSAYRRAVDLYFKLCQKAYGKEYQKTMQTLDLRKTVYEQWLAGYSINQEREQLADIYNRGNFTTGYFTQRNGADMMSMERNSHNGIYMGTVSNISGGSFLIKLDRELNAGDILEIRTKNGTVIELTSGTAGDAGSYVKLNGKQMKQMKVGDAVYRTKNHALCRKLIEENAVFTLKENIHISVMCRKDLPVTIRMECGEISVKVMGSCAVKAEKQPITQSGLEEKLRKLGDAPFQIEAMEFDLDSDCFFSMKEFNQMRRRAIELLEDKCRTQNVRTWKPVQEALERDFQANDVLKKRPELAVYVSTWEQLREILETNMVSYIGLEVEALAYSELKQMISEIQGKTSECGAEAKVILALPHIYRLDMKDDILKLLEFSVEGYLVRTMDELALLREQGISPDKAVTLDFGIYTYNRKAVACLKDWMNVSSVTLPVEYSKEDLLTLLEQAPDTDWEWIIYGKQMLMVSAQCTYKNLGTCRREQAYSQQSQQLTDELEHDVLLKNQFGDEFHVERICKYCYNVIYQNQPDCYFKVLQELPQKRLRTIRMHLINETSQEVKELLQYHIPKNSGLGRFRKGIE